MPPPTAPPSAEAQLADLAEQMADELRDKGAVDAAAWQQRHPDLASEILRLIPALEALADLSSGGTGILPVSDADEHVATTDYEEAITAKTLGDFRLLRELGRGGMGIVYEAEQLSLNRRVALKILPMAAVLDPRTLQRFKNEAQAAAALDHPHIVDVYGVGGERGIHYYAMRLIDGCTLADVIAERKNRWEGEAPAEPHSSDPTGSLPLRAPTNPNSKIQNLKSAADTATFALISTQPAATKGPFFRAVAELAAHVADALQHAHDQGVVHRDIKPSNLMLDAQGKIWITDFGVARIEANQSLTQTGDLLGTLRYMSPEQSCGNPAAIDPRSDLYSLGATLYELLTLQPLFGDCDRASLLGKITAQEPSRPRALNAHIPGDLETIILKLIEKEPARRYASAGDLSLDLRRFIENKPIAARRPSLGQRLAKWSARNRSLVANFALSAFLIAAISGGVLGWWTRDNLAKKQTATAIATTALGSAAAASHDNRWPLAITELERAETALATISGESALSRDIAAAKRDAQMAIRLEEIRLQAAMLAAGDFDFATADTAYDSAFGDFGIPVSKLTIPAAVQQITDSKIPEQLAAALTDWSIVRKRLPEPSQPDWRQFVSIARQADPDPWRNRFRKTQGWSKNDVLEAAESPGLWKQSPHTLFLFVTAAMNQQVSDDAAQKIIRDLQRLHAHDFWLNFAVALYFDRINPPQWTDAARFYSVAAGLRPTAAAVYNNLGRVFHLQRMKHEAIAEYQRAIDLSPDAYQPHFNLAFAYAQLDRQDDAHRHLQMAIKLGHNNHALTNALQKLTDAGATWQQLPSPYVAPLSSGTPASGAGGQGTNGLGQP